VELRLRALAERARTSLFWVPAMYVVGATILSVAIMGLDDLVVDPLRSVPLLLSVTVDSARSILGTIAGATITVAGIVVSITVVSVQLASSQFSPRVLRGFLRDRFQQNAIGAVLGTFTYCLLVLGQTRVSGPEAEVAPAPSLAVTLAIVLAVASMLAIISFIDHSARAMQVGHIIRRITDETLELIRHTCRRKDEHDPVRVREHPLPEGPKAVVRADRNGWVQQLDRDALVAALPAGSYARLDVRVGGFVTDGIRLCTYWVPEDTPRDQGERVAHRLRSAIALGEGRTMQQDIAFGLRQLIDIGLRALSPGINDPTTAIEVLVHLGGILAELQRSHLPSRVLLGDEGQVVVATADLDYADYVGRGFDQLRHVAADHPAVLITMLKVLGQLAELARHEGHDGALAPLALQASLVRDVAEQAGHHPHDLERIRDEAHRTGLLPEDDEVESGTAADRPV
jgi:uncharacterized membrane protein